MYLLFLIYLFLMLAVLKHNTWINAMKTKHKYIRIQMSLACHTLSYSDTLFATCLFIHFFLCINAENQFFLYNAETSR